MNKLTQAGSDANTNSAYTLSAGVSASDGTAIVEPELRQMVCDDPVFLIDGQLPVGYTILMGAPKTGKTALLLPIGQSLADRGLRVLYIALDDTIRRMRDRDLAASPDKDYPLLWFYFGWQPKDRISAFSQLESMLTRSRDAGEPFDLVIIDTYGRFIGRRPAGDVFGFDYETGQAFKNLCERQHTSVLITHHTRKGPAGEDWLDQMSGSAGMAASCDAIWYIERTRGSREGVLYMTGNDVEEHVRPLTLGSDMVWRASSKTTVAQAMHTGCPRAVLDYLMEHSLAPLKEIQEGTGEAYNTVRSALGRLHTEGLVDTNGDAWSLTDHPDNSLPDPWTRDNADSARPESTSTSPAPAGPTNVPPPPHPETVVGEQDQSALPAAAAPPEPKRSILPTLALDTSEMATAAELAAVDDPKARTQLAKRGAIKASMKLMKQSVQRDTARYRPSLFAKQPPLEAAQIWEGRNRWYGEVEIGATVAKLDKGAAYLSAANTALPIGALQHDDDPWTAAHGPDRRAGYHLVTIPEFEYPCGGPFHTREERGPVWITTPTLKQLISRADWPRIEILESWTAPATEVLMRPWIETLRDTRARALAADDRTLYQFTKYCYSLVIATMGESSANWEINRPDWMHIIRAQAYANLWRMAVKAQRAGVTVAYVGNTDELHVVDDQAAAAAFPLGTKLGQWKVKERVVIGQPDTDDQAAEQVAA